MKAITVYTAYASFIMFVLLLLLINSYFLISLNMEKRKNNKIKKQKEIIKKLLVTVVENEEGNKETINLLKAKLNRKTDIQAFHQAVKEYESENINNDKLSHLLEEIVDIKKIIKSGIVRKEYKESYALYLISEFNMGNKKAGDFALASLEKNSLHVRNNALNVINKNNDLSILMKGIEKINEKNHYFNDKMIIDFLDNYKGNKEELDDCLYTRMDSYNINLRKNIISHFINRANGSQKIKDKMLNLMQHSDEKEIIISSIRYFYKIIDHRAEEYLLKNMTSKDWEVRATTARVIYKYSSEKIINKLKLTLTDENYYVRSNGAESFLKLVDSEIAIEEAIVNKDRFARDILLYAMNIRGIISIEEYERVVNQRKEAENMKGVVLT